jgi:hypothetical protein
MEQEPKPSGVSLPLLLKQKWQIQQRMLQHYTEGQGAAAYSPSEGTNQDTSSTQPLLRYDRRTPLSRHETSKLQNKVFTTAELEQRIYQTTVAMVDIQMQLHRGEEIYFEDTVAHGNMFKGWDAFVDLKMDDSADNAMGPPRRVPADSRWFSSSCKSISQNFKPVPPMPVQKTFPMPTVTTLAVGPSMKSVDPVTAAAASLEDQAVDGKLETSAPDTAAEMESAVTNGKNVEKEAATTLAAGRSEPCREETKDVEGDVEMKDAPLPTIEEASTDEDTAAKEVEELIEKESAVNDSSAKEEQVNSKKRKKREEKTEDDQSDDKKPAAKDTEEPPAKKQEIERPTEEDTQDESDASETSYTIDDDTNSPSKKDENYAKLVSRTDKSEKNYTPKKEEAESTKEKKKLPKRASQLGPYGDSSFMDSLATLGSRRGGRDNKDGKEKETPKKAAASTPRKRGRPTRSSRK